MIKTMIEEFNCNHQADIDSAHTEHIYNRDDEHSKIRKFIETNIRQRKSGLMYLCGHPGTGKTSSLNYVLSELRKVPEIKFEPLLFNAMTYCDVKSFSLVLHQDLHEKFLGEKPKRIISRSSVDDEDMAEII